MGLLDRFRNPAATLAAGTAQGLMEGAGQLALNLRTAITGEEPISAEAAAGLAVQAKQIEADILLAQAKINEAEAKSSRFFVAGWRPFIGWTLGVALAMEYVVRPVVYWTTGIGLEQLTDTLQLFGLLAGMLGMAAYRTVEKANGTVGTH